MSWCYVLGRAGADFSVNDNFPKTFVDFSFKIFIQERISTYDDPCPQTLQLQASFKCRCQSGS